MLTIVGCVCLRLGVRARVTCNKSVHDLSNYVGMDWVGKHVKYYFGV